MNVVNVVWQLMQLVLTVIAPLVDDILTLDDGTEVQISKCPNEHGKIKSPSCCGQEMSCTA